MENERDYTGDTKLAFEVLRLKGKRLAKLWAYYDGDQPLVYSTERLRAVFANLDTKFAQNWCGVVVDAVADRLDLRGFEIGGGDKAQKRLAELLRDTELELDAPDAHLAMVVTGEAFVIAWPSADPEQEGEIEAYYNDPRLCHLFYESDNPRKKRMGCKWWAGDDGRYYLNLYYRDEIVYLATKKMESAPTEATAFVLRDDTGENPAKHDHDIIPLFRLQRERRKVKGELDGGVLPLQDAINKLFSDMMVSAEFGAFRQRWIISNADTGDLKNAPNEIWSIPAGDGVGQGTQAGEFAPADLSNFSNQMDKLATSIAVITRTPKHYFYAQGGDPSGEALIAMEAPLNRKVALLTARCSPTWRRIAAFLLKLDGIEVNVGDISPIWAPVETVQPLTQSTIRLNERQAEIPLETVLRREGWTKAEIEQMQTEQDEAAGRQQATMARALLQAQRSMDSGQESMGLE